MAFEVIETVADTQTLKSGFEDVNTNFAQISSTSAGQGASLVALQDAGASYDAATVELAFAELASPTSGQGASIIGYQDVLSRYGVYNVEAALNVLVTTGGAGIVGIVDTAEKFNAGNVEDALNELTLTTTNNGASIIGLEDASNFYGSSVNVEQALYALGSTNGAGIVGILDSADNFTSADVEGALAELATGVGGTPLHPGSIVQVYSLDYNAVGSSSIAIPTNSGSIRLHTFTDCYINFGDSGVAADGTDGIPFLAGTEIIGIPTGSTHIAIKGMTVGATANIVGLDQDTLIEIGSVTTQVYYGAGSYRIAKPSTLTNRIRIYNPTDCYINFGDSTVTSSSTTGMFLEAGIETLHINAVDTHIAVSKYMLEGTAYITGMN